MNRQFSIWILAALALSGCGKSAQHPPSAKPKITVITPEARDVLEYEDLPGRVEAIEDVEVKARVGGYLTKVNFKEGTEVPAGELLYTIDPREYQAVYDSAVANLQQAQARLSQARSDFQRAQQLSQRTVIPKQELETRGTDVLGAEAQVRFAEANVNKARLDLEFTEIRAPIAGKVSRTRITEGNLVSIGDTLTSVVRQDPVYVYIDAPERVILKWDRLLKDSSTEGFTSKVKVAVGLLNEEGFPRQGSVDFTDNSLNQGTGTLQIRATLPNADRKLRVGLYARVRLSINQPRPALLVPERSVGVDQGNRFVYVVGPDGKVDYRTVKVGQVYDGKLSVIDGLKPGDRVAVEGLQMIRPGLIVEPVEVPAAAATATPSS